MCVSVCSETLSEALIYIFIDKYYIYISFLAKTSTTQHQRHIGPQTISTNIGGSLLHFFFLSSRSGIWTVTGLESRRFWNLLIIFYCHDSMRFPCCWRDFTSVISIVTQSSTPWDNNSFKARVVVGIELMEEMGLQQSWAPPNGSVNVNVTLISSSWQVDEVGVIIFTRILQMGTLRHRDVSQLKRVS